MGLFRKKREEEYDSEDDDLFEAPQRRIRDLKPENRKKRVEPPKPWGKRERYIVLFVFLGTILTAAVLAVSARSYKLPGLPKFDFNFNNPFAGEVIVVGGKNSKYQGIAKSFEEKTKNLSGIYALKVIDLNSNSSFGINNEKSLQAASLIKLPTLGALYKSAEEGSLNLDTKYTLKNSDKRAGSGSLSSKPAGTVLTYRDLARLMGGQSDNTAFNIVRNLLGDKKIEEVAREFGMDKTSIADNLTTPNDVGNFFTKLWRGEVIGEKSRDEILGFLTDTIYEDWLVKGIPDGVKVSHKFGREIHVINDGGIVFSTNPYVVVIMTQGIVENEANTVFPELSRMVYDGMTK